MQQEEYYSNGKLLISGEYLVLHGAKALAVPLKFGQNLKVRNTTADEDPILNWESLENGLSWFELEASCHDLTIHRTTNVKIANRLIDCLQKAKQLNPEFLNDKKNTQVKTNLTFNREWGLGSSSTLINNIANWAGVDAYKLLDLTFGGSGFDIACASAEKAVFYRKKNDSVEINDAYFDPAFKDQLFFIYLGLKQDSSHEIHRFEAAQKYSASMISEISEISELMATTKDQAEFGRCITTHEKIISSIINQKAVKPNFFPDFEGEIKSLGAWGGDFVLALSSKPYSEIKSYFEHKGLSVIFMFTDLIK